jgi:hypothetical protein
MPQVKYLLPMPLAKGPFHTGNKTYFPAARPNIKLGEIVVGSSCFSLRLEPFINSQL